MQDRRKFKILTYGCQMNTADSEMISGVLKKMGFIEVEDMNSADLLLVNTCAVRTKPEEKVYGRLSNFQHLKEKNPLLLIGICGCMAQKEKEKIIEKAPFVDLVFGPQSIGELPVLIEQAFKVVGNKRRQMEKLEGDKKLKSRFRGAGIYGNFENTGDNLPEKDVSRESNFKAFVTIMRGCNNFCSYCVVPHTRGREKSRSFEVILGEVEELIKSGYKEITLLGQNVNSYNGGSNRSFPELLAAIDKIPGKFYLRYTTSHPKDLSDELIDVMAKGVHIAPHVHLPFQSGSSKILKLMNRKYTREHYISLIEKIRAKIPGVSLTTDVIAGFAQETREDFEDTVSLLKLVRYDSAYLFYYSEREGTDALSIEGAVPVKERIARLEELIELQMNITFEINRNMAGELHEGIVEGAAPKNPDEYSVRTFDNHVVIVPRPEGAKTDITGEFVNLKITEGYNFVLRGEILS